MPYFGERHGNLRVGANVFGLTDTIRKVLWMSGYYRQDFCLFTDSALPAE